MAGHATMCGSLAFAVLNRILGYFQVFLVVTIVENLGFFTVCVARVFYLLIRGIDVLMATVVGVVNAVYILI